MIKRAKSLLLLLFSFYLLVGCSATDNIQKDESIKHNDFYGILLDTVSSQRFDTGRMWTFDDPPLKYFKETYNFEPDQEWLDHVRKSALKFATWCSASFVSADGLIMTNHHCVENVIPNIQQEGEDLFETGFYAPTLEEERKVEGVFVDQLVLIEDITERINDAAKNIQNEQEALTKRNEEIKVIKDEYSNETGLVCEVVSFYNGAKYSLYGYKRFNDVRAVFVAEKEIGLYGGDPDNFTYPRYNLDCSFLRVYGDDGKPLQAENYFKWSKEGAKEGEPIFVVGNPGSTNRLMTVSQLEYNRDISTRNIDFLIGNTFQNILNLLAQDAEKYSYLNNMVMMLGNASKVYKYLQKSLNNPIMMARKKDFENKLKNEIAKKPDLQKKYGHVWDAIKNIKSEMKIIAGENAVYSVNPLFSPAYISMTDKLLNLSNDDSIDKSKIDSILASLYPNSFNETAENLKLKLFVDYAYLNLEPTHPLRTKLFQSKTAEVAYEDLLKNSIIVNKEKLKKALLEDHKGIKALNDPLIIFAKERELNFPKISEKYNSLLNEEKTLQNQLGRVLYEVHGTSIPPDATFTLRLNDGELKNYEYNGTIAPMRTTFYGLYDRY